MGDCGSNLLGLLLGAVIIEGTLKTNALIALVGPLVVLAVPFLDTGFVVAKRIKYRRAVYRGDSNHFHHRFHRIGFSQRRTVLYLYAWTLIMAGDAVALRFIPYSERSGHLNAGWAALMGALLLIGVAASVYLDLRARDPQAAAPARLAAAARRPGHDRARDRRAGRARARDRRVPLARVTGFEPECVASRTSATRARCWYLSQRPERRRPFAEEVSRTVMTNAMHSMCGLVPTLGVLVTPSCSRPSH